MYFLGHAGCVQVNGLRIAGASGIFKSQDFPNGERLRNLTLFYSYTPAHEFLGYWERLPYTPSAMRSIYHIREYNIRRLSLVRLTITFPLPRTKLNQ